jgi:hypothetical protein
VVRRAGFWRHGLKLIVRLASRFEYFPSEGVLTSLMAVILAAIELERYLRMSLGPCRFGTGSAFEAFYAAPSLTNATNATSLSYSASHGCT